MNWNTIFTLESLDMAITALVLVLVIESLFHHLGNKNKKQKKQEKQQ